ncbi:hypothetical protein KPH14_009301 [Odynerus spinipes]|uniref:Uncharacterized protein n=1 Tax=Odynerus spinipes TaxID=1348599 RepID=A0AAD9RP29_9HYME|nr:hypothetical protein KPH14_009301 [Odynerus spinipes]
MNSGDIVDKNDIKVHSKSDSLTSCPNQPIDKTERNFLREQQEENSSSGSSPSTLRKRLQELPSTARSIDRASLGHRISRNREACHRTSSARSHIELNDDKEDRNEISLDLEENSSIASSHRSQGARARRRAKIRSEILDEIDKSLAVTRSSLNDFLNLVDKSDEERRSTGKSITDSVESLESNNVEDSKDFLMLRRQPSFVCGSLTSRSYYRDNEVNEKERDRVPRQSKSAKEDRNSYDYHDDDLTSNNKLLKNRIELCPISALPASNATPLKFGGYRPRTGIILNNMSSGSESECFNDASNYGPRKIASPIVNTELSTPVSDSRTLEEGIKTLPVLSARNDDNQALSSFRSFPDTPGSRISIGRTSGDRERRFNVTSYFEENLNNGENIRENELNSLPLKSTKISKISMNDRQAERKKSLEINVEIESRYNSYEASHNPILLLRNRNSKSTDDLSAFPKRHKELSSCPSTAKYNSDRDNFVSTTRIDSEDRSSSRTSNHNQTEKTPSFLNVKLIEDLETLDTPDNERQDNIANVPALPLHSEDASRSTSADSKMYAQNCSLDRNALTMALSNVTSNSTRDKETSLTRPRHRFYDDNEKAETFKSDSSDKISMLSRTWQAPVSIESRNLYESYNEFDVMAQSRRAFSAPCNKLSNENPESATTDTRREESSMMSNMQPRMHDELRYQSADLLRQPMNQEHNFNQLFDSSYASQFAQNTGCVNFLEDYRTLSDPLEMVYSREGEFNSHTFDYGVPCMYPRQSHLSVLQEESETRLEENGRSESAIGKNDSSIVDSNYEKVYKIDVNEKLSTPSTKEQSVSEREIEKGQRTSRSNETKDGGDDGRSNDANVNYHKNNEDSDDTLTKNDSSSDTRTHESHTDSICSSSQSMNSKSPFRMKNIDWDNEEEKTNDVGEVGDEFQPDKSFEETIDTAEYRSKNMYNQLNGPPTQAEGIGPEDTWLMNEENSRLQVLKAVQPETTIFVIQKVHELCTVPAKASCSTSRLHCPSERVKDSPGSKNKRSSQDRFPFTISETRSMISTSNKKQGHCENVGSKTRSLETFRSFAHPILKEFIKTPVETVDCFNYGEQRQEQRNLVPKMKGFVRRFSKKLKISRRRNDLDDPTTKVIYQNRECQVESVPETGSDDSSIKESEWVVPRSANTRSSVISSGKSLKKAMSLENLTLCTEYPRRRYDRDDLWVKELQERIPARDSARTSSKERFSLFTSKSSGSSLLDDSKKSWRTPEKNSGREYASCKKEDQVNTARSSTLSPSNVNKSNVDFNNEKIPDAKGTSNDTENGCACFKLIRMITCSLLVRSHGGSLIESKRKKKNKRSRSSLKRRKG